MPVCLASHSLFTPIEQIQGRALVVKELKSSPLFFMALFRALQTLSAISSDWKNLSGQGGGCWEEEP